MIFLCVLACFLSEIGGSFDDQEYMDAVIQFESVLIPKKREKGLKIRLGDVCFVGSLGGSQLMKIEQ
ncbi:MAG: hypothetical protein JJU23_04690 [Cyclobacteriaceae bacterium]|nr:hypothetical protein [Cyclobacteriaceae bacterium]